MDFNIIDGASLIIIVAGIWLVLEVFDSYNPKKEEKRKRKEAQGGAIKNAVIGYVVYKAGKKAAEKHNTRNDSSDRGVSFEQEASKRNRRRAR